MGGIDTDKDILVSISSDHGSTWCAPVALASNAGSDTGEDDCPGIVSLGPDRFLVVWRSSDDHGLGLGTDNDIVYATTSDGGASWTPPAPLNSLAASDTSGDGSPSIRRAGGTLLATWHSSEDFDSSGTDNDIVVSRSIDGGASWSPQALLADNATGDSGSDAWVRAEGDGNGNWVAIWHSSDNLGGDRDRLRHLGGDLGRRWHQLDEPGRAQQHCAVLECDRRASGDRQRF